MCDPPEYLTPQERAVLALWLLIQVPMSTREIAERCGMEMAGAWKMLNRISRVVPLYRDAGKWRILRIS
jgi:DNA-binding IclR family transcriptional regulator